MTTQISPGAPTSCWQNFREKAQASVHETHERFSQLILFEMAREVAAKISLIAIATLALHILKIPCWWSGLGMCCAIIATRLIVVIIDTINPKILLKVKNKAAEWRRCLIWLYRALFIAALAASFIHPAIGITLGVVCGIVTECVYDRKVSIDNAKEKAAQLEEENTDIHKKLAEQVEVVTLPPI